MKNEVDKVQISDIKAGLIIVERMKREGAEIRSIEIKDEIWFVAKDIAEIFNYRNHKDMLEIIEDEDKRKLSYNEIQSTLTAYPNKWGKINSNGMYFINESAVYWIVMNSKLPICKRFKKWVTHEVLPEINRTGSYSFCKGEKCLLTTSQWLEVRNKAKDGAQHLNLLGKYLGEDRYWDIKHIRDHIYKCVFGDSAKELREFLNLPELTNLRDYLNEDGLDIVMSYEQMAALMIEREMNLNQVRSNLSIVIATSYPDCLEIRNYLIKNNLLKGNEDE